MSAADYSVHGPVAVIAMNNPPVNGLGHALRTGLMEGLQRAVADQAVRSVVIIGSASAFSGGADIREFNTPKSTASPRLHDIIELLDGMDKPVVAAIGGFAMGGGFELALACHYRVAAPKASLALPEVKLGILPGAGGTQRLPRVIPVADALQMMVSGNPIPSEKGKALGAVEEIVEGDLLAGALAYAQKLLAAGKGRRCIRDMSAKLDNAAQFFEQARAETARASRGYPAPLEIVACVEAAVTRPFDDGLKFERSRFEHLVNTTESKAMRHMFFAERQTTRIPDVPESTPAREIRKAAVIGAGTMGGGIAMNFANAGIPVTMIEMKQEALDRGLATILKNYTGTMKKGRLTQEQLDQRMALIRPSLANEDIRDADIVIEAVFEDIEVKKAVFEKLDALAKPGAILASNTSTLDLDRIAAFTRRPADVIGMHFFSPANVMRLLEVVRGAKTGKDVLATTMKLAKKIKKLPVVSGVCDGFIGNRMLEQYVRQALFLLDEGALPQQIDGALQKWGMAMGPFAMSDLAGNDIGWYVRKRRRVEQPEIIYSGIADRLCELGRFGQKSGAGWYRYEAGNRTPQPDPAVEKLIADYRAQAGIKTRPISDEEIIERCIFSLANEGAAILEEGIALRASDIDMVYLSGYGFPPYRGGPMFHADTVGLKKMLATIEGFAGGYQGSAWKPAPLLVKLAAEGKTFN